MIPRRTAKLYWSVLLLAAGCSSSPVDITHAHGMSPSDLGAARDLGSGGRDPSDLAGAGVFVVEQTGLDSSIALNRPFGFAAGDVYVPTNQGLILHSTGDGKWTIVRGPPDGGTLHQEVNGVWGLAANDVYAFGTQEALGSGATPTALLLHSTGNGVFSAESFPGSDASYIGIGAFGGSAETDLYAGVVAQTRSNAGIFHSSDRANWAAQTSVSAPPIAGASSLFVASPASVYLTDARIWHSTGDGNWTLETISGVASPEIASIWASSPADVFAVGSSGAPGSQQPLVLHSTGNGQWTQQSLPAVGGSALSSVFGTSPDEVWAVGNGSGAIVHYDGATWSQVPSPITAGLSGVWAGGGEVYVTAQTSVILHLR